MPVIVARHAPADIVARLIREGMPPLLARIYAARGILSPQQLATDFDRLLPPAQMLNLQRMAQLLADAIAARKKLLIIADYDADGATACAVGLRALRGFGATVDYLVPNRFEYGYGLTPEIVRLAHDIKKPDILITVDNGIASVEGVAEANRLGLQVLITDHHLPGSRLPDAWCIINPNQPGCTFPSKNLAGVGVMFYLMLALRAELRERGWFVEHSPPSSPALPALTPDPSTVRRHRGPTGRGEAIVSLLLPGEGLEMREREGSFVPASGRVIRIEPNLADLLDLVALGTVADVVKLDDNNRILVQQGLKRMRAGRIQPGIAALFQIAGRDPRRASAYDMGFVLAPRLNAAGRLSDMSLGIECLATDNMGRALQIAAQLDQLNRERRAIESDMQDAALASLERMAFGDSYTLSLFDPAWHQGVVGIVASRIKDRFHRPVIAFARGNDGEIKGSGRSIGGLHLRDALDVVAKRHPDLLVRFGGHAAAAGVTLRETDFERFRTAFEQAVQALLSPADLERRIETDGPLEPGQMTLETASALDTQVWGQGFPRPCFDDCFEVVNQRVVGERHLKLRLARAGVSVEAMLFRHDRPLPSAIRAVYRIEVNEYNGARSLQLTLEHWQPAAE
ncbi:MAG: single-stranded-DNA-specific exonuclease RecJ [Burkholderiales bacterium]|nr:single-stranded-DNA-specific exonuclease RecJ [Burkholderiales bacterium]